MKFITEISDGHYMQYDESEMGPAVWILGFIFSACFVAWVFGAFDADAAPRPQAAPKAAAATSWAGSCRMRSGPGTEFEIIGSTRPSKTYTVLETDGGWKRIGPRGWIGCR